MLVTLVAAATVSFFAWLFCCTTLPYFPIQGTKTQCRTRNQYCYQTHSSHNQLSSDQNPCDITFYWLVNVDLQMSHRYEFTNEQ